MLASQRPLLFEPLQIRGLSLKNRIMMSPMAQYSAIEGLANQWHFCHLGARGVGGVGLVFVEGAAVSRDGRITPGCLGLWSEAHRDHLVPIVEFLHQQGAAVGIQIFHAGRKGSCDVPWRGGKPLSPPEAWPLVAPSALAYSPESPVPEPLDSQDMRHVLEEFVHAAILAAEAKFDVLELHMAHGYLLHEFLSPLTNQRSDSYGGQLENRLRYPLEVAAAVREVWPKSKPLFVRVSATDWVEGGWDLEQTVILAGELVKLGVDVLDCSSGGLLSYVRIPRMPGYQVPFSQVIRYRADIRTVAVGGISHAHHAETILHEGKADLISLGRELLRNPYWPMSAAKDLGSPVFPPPQYERAYT